MTTSRYRQCPFPKMSDLTGQPLMFCCKFEADNQCQILAPGPVPTPADAFLRFVHEEFFVAAPFAVANCEYYLTERLYVDDVVNAYVSSYVLSVHG
ncbi:hypothetical protein JTB14_023467 [Gonioctena quinquepunctata]|nr:hypothetical protein JTB14_023467 [Gonioctena quinquepunctata]